MANLKDIRIRINSVRTTRQVTSAMKMVSAAKFKKAQDDVDHIRVFVGKLLAIVTHLGNSVENIEERFAGFRVSQRGKILMVPIASNKGLAGAFNANVIKETERVLRHDYRREYAAGEVDIMPIGKQVTKALASHGIKMVGDHNELLDQTTTENCNRVAEGIMKDFVEGKYRAVVIVYNRFVNAAVQQVSAQQLLPLQLPTDVDTIQYRDYIVEPNVEEALEALIPQAVSSLFHATMLESAASEHGARMTSMHKATDNATELLSELQLQYNKARQGAITGELIEIVSGAEALNN